MDDQHPISTQEPTTSPGLALKQPGQTDSEELVIVSTQFSRLHTSMDEEEPAPAPPPLPTSRNPRGRTRTALHAYGAALMVGLAVVPIVITALTVVFYLALSGVPSWLPLLLGAASATLLWWLISIPLSFLTAPEIFNIRSYGLLSTRLDQLNSRLHVIQDMTYGTNMPMRQQTALDEAFENCAQLQNMLYLPSSRIGWVLGLGYVNAWARVHRTEEALIELEAIEMVIRGAWHDKLSIGGSGIRNAEELLENLCFAVKALDPDMALLFQKDGPTEEAVLLQKLDLEIKRVVEQVKDETATLQQLDQDILQVSQHLKIAASDTKDTKKHDSHAHESQPSANVGGSKANGRAILREVRRTLNEYRDNLWENIIHARNQLMGTVFVTGLVTHVLLCIAILASPLLDNSSQAARSSILAAIAFYSAGGIAGLFGRIYRESTMTTAQGDGDNYGLSLARLISTPLLSGLAGIGGVLIYSTVSLQGAPAIPTSLASVFNLSRLDFIIAAAITGYAPGALFQGFSGRTNNYLSALQSSKPTTTANSSNRQNGEN